VQFGARAAVRGPDRAAETARLGRWVAKSGSRERCGSTGRVGEDSGRRAGLAGADQCGVARGGGASGVTLAGVKDGEDLDRSGGAIDEQVVGMDHRLACAGYAAGAANLTRCAKNCRAELHRAIAMSNGDIIHEIVGSYVPLAAKREVSNYQHTRRWRAFPP